MSNIELIRQSAEINPLYLLFEVESFWERHNNVILNQTWVPRYKKYSDWSLSFNGDLKQIFNIKNQDTFDYLYKKATNGPGQEKNKIKTLHSSSLMPLLFFHSISADNPFYVSIEGKMVPFTRYVPEEENEVEPGSKNKSSVDVALFNDIEKIIVLFESKFSEYLVPDSTGVSLTPYYHKIYRELEDTFKTIGIEVKDWDSYKTSIRTVKGGAPRYCQGPKQMISHFLGVKTEISRKFLGYRVFLGELLFDFNDVVPGARDCLNKYRDEVYAPLASALREFSKGDFSILPITTFQELISYEENQAYYNNLEQEIKEYYRL